MNKTQTNMEQMAALRLIAYAVGLLVGERLRNELYGPEPNPHTPLPIARNSTEPYPTASRRKWRLYFGLFILLKHKLSLSRHRLRRLIDQVLLTFAKLRLHS